MISRRFFVMGTAAVVAAAAAPTVVQAIEPATIDIVRVPVKPLVIRRSLVEFWLGDLDGPRTAINTARILRPGAEGKDPTTLMHFHFNGGSVAHWAATPLSAVVMDPALNALSYLDWQNAPQFGTGVLTFIDKLDDGTSRMVDQRMEFLNGLLVHWQPQQHWRE